MTQRSRYTHEFDLPDGSVLLSNLLWSTMLQLSDHEASEWRLGRGFGPVLQDKLLFHNMVTNSDFNELDLISRSFQASRYSAKVLGLTIAPTIDCNFACVYCYEAKRPGRMTAEVEDAVLQYVENNLPGRDSLNVIWYGGEPLMCKETIFRLSDAFIEKTQRLGSDYSFSMVTNGLLLDRATADRLASYGHCDFVQITLDGLPETHDVKRPTRGGQATFQRVLTNLTYAASILPVVLRMNVDRQTFDSCLLLLDYLGERLDTTTITATFGAIHNYGKGCRDLAEKDELAILDNVEFAKMEVALIERASSRGFGTSTAVDQPPVRSCQAVSTHSIIVEPDGGLHRCWAEVGEDDKRIGNLGSPINLTSNNSTRWLQYDPTKAEPCRSCDVLPTCFGGCPQRHLDGRPMEMTCSTIRFNTREAVLARYLTGQRSGGGCGSCQAEG